VLSIAYLKILPRTPRVECTLMVSCRSWG